MAINLNMISILCKPSLLVFRFHNYLLRWRHKTIYSFKFCGLFFTINLLICIQYHFKTSIFNRKTCNLFLSGRRNLSIFRTKISLLNGKYILSIHSLFCRYSYAACKYSRAVAAACTFFVFPENCEKKFIFLHDEWIFFRMSFF